MDDWDIEELLRRNGLTNGMLVIQKEHQKQKNNLKKIMQKVKKRNVEGLYLVNVAVKL
jgi:hypothetical protein